MTLVDTSVWIDFLNGKDLNHTQALRALMRDGEVAIGDLIATEVMQGFRSEQEAKRGQRLLNLYPCFSLVGKQQAFQAASHYRALRTSGITIRKTIDVLIASFCVENQIPLLFADRDFRPFVQQLGLHAAVGSAISK